jgi:hypothetical protein
MAMYRFQRGKWTDEDEAILEGDSGAIDADALKPFADALGGNIDGAFVVAPKVTVRVDPANPNWFFVYRHSFSSLAAAKAHVREKLKLIEPVMASAAERSSHALRLWDECIAASGEVEVYLRGRGLPPPYPATLRLHPRLWHSPTRHPLPAMVALVIDIENRPVAIHRTYLRSSGRGKALVSDPKLSLGPVMGGAIRLAMFDPDRPLMIGEGIETCMSAIALMGHPAWSAVSAVNLARHVRLPAEARDIILLADNDAAGEDAVMAAAARFRIEGRRVRIARPPADFKDFNDLLTGKRRADDKEPRT